MSLISLCAAILLLLLILLRRRNRLLSDQLEERSSQCDRAREALYIDGVTGCRNARAYHEDFSTGFSLRDAGGQTPPPPSLLVAIDSAGGEWSLKSINDRFGYEAGDRCIAALARAVRSVFRGERFTVYYLGASVFLVLGRGSFTAEELHGRCLELKRLWRDTPQDLGEDIQAGPMALRFSAVPVGAGIEE